MAQAHDLAALGGLSEDEIFAAVVARGDLPRHVAVIMDGNGRWARKRRLPRVAGHRAGRHAVRRSVEASGRLGLEVLTLYTFSQENFNRPAAEVKALWHFLQESLVAEQDELHRRGVRLVATGDLDRLPGPAQEALQRTVDALAGNTGLVLNLAVAYGGRQEIVAAARALARRVAAGGLDPETIGEEDFARGLWTAGLPDPDLVIRTSGEARLSNFLLWQAAYAELLITPVLWPDFGARDLALAVADFQNRERRFGALPADEQDLPPADPAGALDPSRWKRLLQVRR
ncbi:MAG: di-trans,poly-cis-decaprenylcistransferase [Krumholzibacteria bacterium]|nr:di-trans,poly-cis-decaprenylcistransferase [Candidatus Krumholzibacteria bacterium]